MKFRTKIICSLFIFLFPAGIFQLSAQAPATSQTPAVSKKDTASFPVDSTRFFSFSENGFPYGNSARLNGIENKLDGFQQFHLRQAGLGNAGAAEKALVLPGIPSTAFRRGPNSFAYFGFLPQNRTFYTSEKPFTRINFIVGTKQELNVKVIHAHPFGKNANVAFGFERIRSTGFYQRQNTNNTSVNLNGWYRAPGKRYAVLSDIYWTAIDAAENGGIANDSSFEFANQLDRHLVAVNLSAAETRQRQRGFWAKQYWSFGNVIDTISDASDSIHVKTVIRPSWAFVHTFSLSDEKHAYKDKAPTSGFYPVIYRDTLLGRDSTNLWRIENGLWLERFDQGDSGKIRFLSGKIGLRHEIGKLHNDTIRYPFQNLFVDGSLKFRSEKFWLDRARLDAWYVLSGTNAGDFRAAFNYESGTFLNKKLAAFLQAGTALTKPDFMYSHYSGNFYRWENDFVQTGVSNLKLGLKSKGEKNAFSLAVLFSNYFKPVYLDSNILPVQYDKSVSAVSLQLGWKLALGNFRMSSDVTWNKIDSAAPIRIPELIARESVFGDFFLFKRALHLQTGVDLTWYSAYYADGYNPALAQFYVQDAEKIGNYVFLDPWLAIKIKPVRVFVKADHINAGWFGRTYYGVPHYPQNDFALKFGLSWTFND